RDTGHVVARERKSGGSCPGGGSGGNSQNPMIGFPGAGGIDAIEEMELAIKVNERAGGTWSGKRDVVAPGVMRGIVTEYVRGAEGLEGGHRIEGIAAGHIDVGSIGCRSHVGFSRGH